jgi:hypothetical protein
VCVCEREKERERRGSAASIATGYGLDDREVEVRMSVGSRISFIHIAQIGSGTHPASHPIGDGGYCRGSKATGA